MMRLCLPIGVAAVMLALAGSASAQTSMFSTRFSGAPNTNVAIGVVNGRVMIVEQNTANGQCRTTQASNESRLTSFVRFAAGNGANRVRVVDGPGTWNSNLCGFNITPIAYSGRFKVQVFGNDGNDVILVTENSSAFGEGGHDIILADGMWNLIAGGSGNDWLIQSGDWGHEGELYGDGGDDRLCDLADGSRFIGGPNRDLGWNGFGTSIEMEGTLRSRDDCDAVVLWVFITQTF